MIHVEHRSLRSFEQDRLSCGSTLIDEHRRVGDEMDQMKGVVEILFDNHIRIERLFAHRGKLAICVSSSGVDLFANEIGIEEISRPDAAPSRFIFIGGSNPAHRSSHAVGSKTVLTRAFDSSVIGQNEMGANRYEETTFAIEASELQFFDLGVEGARVDDRAVTDDAGAFVVEDSRRYEVKHEFSIADSYGVPGVVPALITGNDVKVGREQIYDLAFSFITPLSSCHYDIFHSSLSIKIAPAELVAGFVMTSKHTYRRTIDTSAPVLPVRGMQSTKHAVERA